jgi:UDP-2,3-diacylglucosamine hydrolase
MLATELIAPPSWRCIDFISDLHLQVSEPDTFAAWESYLTHTAADAVFILGDLFEVWVGDDCLLPNSFEQRCADVLKRTSARNAIYVMHGNRDFLLSTAFMKTSGCTPLPDPTVIALGGTRWLLTHGDSLCLDDVDYQHFRKIVRGTQWQQAFLSKPLLDRESIAKGIRSQSEDRKRSTVHYADADTAATVALLNSNAAQHMIHGHTHRPATHTLPSGQTRTVLSDWDQAASPPRAEVLRLQLHESHGWTSQRIAPEATSTRLG